MVDRGWGSLPLDTGKAVTGGSGEELTVNLNVAEATGGSSPPRSPRRRGR
jgi:hypothetical protein